MKNYSSREVIAVLHQNGFQEDKRRRTGGDSIFIKEGCKTHVKVPTNRKSIANGTQSNIAKQAGVTFTKHNK